MESSKINSEDLTMFLHGDGAMRNLLRSIDWSATDVGAVFQWDSSFKTAVNICLSSPLPSLICWGAKAFLIYNDAWYNSFHGFPAVGNAADSQNELWLAIKPQILEVISTRNFLTTSNLNISSKENQDQYFSITCTPLSTKSEHVEGVFITLQKEALGNKNSEILTHPSEQETRDRLNLALEISGLGSFELDLVTREPKFSERYLEIMGSAGKGDFKHEDVLKRIHPEDVHIRNEAMRLALETGKVGYEMRILWPDKSIHWIRVSGKVFYEDGNPRKFLGTIMDIDEEKNFLHVLAESEQRFKTIADHSPVMIWMSGIDKRFNFFNQRWLEFTGRTLEDETINGWAEGIHPDDLDRCLEIYSENFIAKSEYHLEYRRRRFDGEYRWVSAKAVPRFSTKQKFEGFIGGCMDIHDRILFEEKLKESESRLRIAALSSELGTWNFNLLTQELNYDPAFRNLFGFDSQTSVPLSQFWDKVETLDRPHCIKKIKETLDSKSGGNFECEFRIAGLPYKQKRWLSAKGKAFFDKENKAHLFSGTVLDITERKVALKRLEDSEERFRFLANFMPQFVWTADKDGNLNYFNQAVFSYSGLSEQELINAGWLKMVHPDDHERNIHLWSESMKTGQDFMLEHRFRNRNGEYRWQLSRALAQKDPNGNIHMWVGTSTDIHDQKLMTNELENLVLERTSELKQTNEELIRTNHELEQFAYVSSHDLQEPLRKIQTFTNMLLTNQGSGRSDFYLEKINASARRMSLLIRDLLNYSRLSRPERQFSSINLNTVMEEVLGDFESTIHEKNAEISIGELPTISGIPVQLTQLFHNLISNALKFSPETPRISITSEKPSSAELNAHNLNPRKKFFRLIIQDNGIGFDELYAQQIFTIFQRLNDRQKFEGTGIGLAICKKITDNHGGAIRANSSPGNGTTFSVYLPAIPPR